MSIVSLFDFFVNYGVLHDSLSLGRRNGLPGAKFKPNALCASVHDHALRTARRGEDDIFTVLSWIKSIGVDDHVTSPTFALEQRYETRLGLLLHIDLYRLTTPQAKELLRATEETDALRCIEWPERAEEMFRSERPIIRMTFVESGTGRDVRFDFDDLPLPSREQIEEWRREVKLPPHIARHCDKVGEVAEALANALLEQRVIARPLALRRAGEVHDLIRFVDFRPGASPSLAAASDDELKTWASWKERYAGHRHEAACAMFLRKRGFDGLARIVETHGMTLPAPDRSTIEQQLLYYADKRVREDQLVTLDERFADFAKRYANGVTTPKQQFWYEEAKALEKELFPEGVPL
jgi:tRNA threonylcarbamoyl adenosine modification protein YjeE